MKSYTLADIRALKPCYDPATKVPEDWTGTAADILRIESISARDRIWVAARLLDDRTARLFAVWCAREALKLVKEPDPRSVMACDVAERFANGAATAEELAAAWAAAGAAAGAAYAYAAYAAYAAAAYAAYAAAASASASASASAAASDAAAASAASASDASDAAARKAQITKLLSMIEAP